MSARVAVIGSNAFSAAHFVDLLLEDGRTEVLGLSRSPEYPASLLAYAERKSPAFRFVQVDLNTQLDKLLAELDAFKPNHVVNFAAQGEVRSSFEHPDHHFRTNALGTVSFIEQLRQRKYLERYVHISTPEVYGSLTERTAENHRYRPGSPCAASKASADLFNDAMFNTFQFPVVTIRATNVYGPYQQLYRIIPRTIIFQKLGKRLPLDGGGRARKSYIHIRDVSEGERAAMLKGKPGEIYHFSPDGEGVEIRELVRMVCAEMGRDFDSSVDIVADRPGQDKAYEIDSTKARTELGWAPRIALQDGIKQCVAWIENHWSEIKDLPHAYIHKA
jgi:dTDP-glucose 4,6-dehydratase